MAIELQRTNDLAAVHDALSIALQEYPELNLLRWAEGDTLADKAAYVAQHVYFWTVWDCGRLLGFVALEPITETRASFHFGARRSINHARVMLSVWRKLLKTDEAQTFRLIVAYIENERADVRKLAHIFKFRRFNDSLWVLKNQNFRKSNRHQ